MNKINDIECKIVNVFGEIDLPLFGTIELTSKCNYRCVHCYGGDTRDIGEIELDFIYSLIDQIVDAGGLSIALTGGEVLTYPHFIPVYKYIKSRGCFVTVLSNASYISKEHIDLFNEYPLSVFSTTMYGATEETYESITGVKGSFKKFINAIEMMNNYDIPVEIKAIALKQNKDEIFKIKQFADDRNIRFIYATNVRPMDTGSCVNQKSQLSSSEVMWFDINDPTRNVFWNNISSIDNVKSRFKRKVMGNYLYLCKCGEQSYFITSNGMLYACAKERFRGIDLHRHPFADSWRTMTDSIGSLTATDNFKCLHCKWIEYCEQCTAENQLATGNVEHPPAYKCELAKMRYLYYSKC